MLPARYFYELTHRRRVHKPDEDVRYDMSMLEIHEAIKQAIPEGKRSIEIALPLEYDERFREEMKSAGYFLEMDPQPWYRYQDNDKSKIIWMTHWKISWKFEPEKWHLTV